MAKGPAVYTILKPETSSDSPSVKLNGAQLVSARVEINHIMARGHDGKINHSCSCVVVRVDRVKDLFIRRTNKRIIARVTLYEIICATARRAPVSAYLGLEAHPDHKIEYTARLDIATMNNTPKFILMRAYGMGRGIHIVNARVRAKIGAMMNMEVEDVAGHGGSLVNRLIASAVG